MAKKDVLADQSVKTTARQRGAIVRVTTLLDWPAERVWEELQKPSLLQHIAAPILYFEAINPPTLPSKWQEGKYLVRMKLFGILSLGTQWIGIEIPSEHAPGVSYRLRDNGYGQLIKVWDHLIHFEPTDDGKTRYTDQVVLDGGLLTPFAWFFAMLFYRHRQQRWRQLVARSSAHNDA